MELSEIFTAEGWSDVFSEVAADATTQTGADWYRLSLAAVFEGKSVHGLNATPSCELLCKQTEGFAEKYATGRIFFNPAERGIPALGSHVTERPYTYRDFKGIRSVTGTFFAFDQGLWEPSKKRRARDAALLAAGIAAATGDQAAARDIASAIASDVVEEQAIEVASIPLSHLKRDVVAISKPSHKVFTCGTIQRAILWKDEQLLSEKFPEVAAIDWGRITTVARYIAEANCQLDPVFRAYASTHGVPYGIVKGSWAHVAFGDYFLDSANFEKIPIVDLASFNIPSLADAYSHSAESMLKLCYVNLNRLAYEDSSPDVVKLLAILEECKFKVRGTAPKRTKWTETEVLAGPSSHQIDAQEAARLTASSGTAFNALVSAVTAYLQQNEDAMRLAREVVMSAQVNRADYQATDNLTRLALQNPTWILATTLLTDALANAALARTRMATLKRKTFKFSGALFEKFTLTARMLADARWTMISLAKKAVIGQVPELPKYNLYTTARALIGTTKVYEAASAAKNHFDDFRKGWATRYAKWASLFKESDDPSRYVDYVNYSTAATAFEKLTVKTALAVESRFIDSTSPKTSYLYACAKAYLKANNIVPKQLPSLVYPTARELADDLDALYSPRILFVDAEAFAYSKVIMFAKDFGISETNVAEAEDREVQRKLAGGVPAPRRIGTVIARMSDEDMAKMAAFAEVVAGKKVGIPTASYNSILSTYDSVQTADKHAIANGYRSYEDAYSALKEKVMFDPESQYTQIGISYTQVEEEAYDDGMILV